jgi:predicted acylesterase/phospholipase RssA
MNNLSNAAISLSGGGLSSIAYAGFNEELLKYHMKPSCYAGLSGGALLAVLLSSNSTTDTIIAFINKLKTFNIINTHWSHFEVIDHLKLIHYIRDALPYKTFESLPTPAVIFATDLTRKIPISIQSGDIASAIVASCSMFPMLEPIKRRGLLLGDGGFTLYYGAQYLKNHHIKKVIGVDVAGLTEGSVGGILRSLFLQINSAITSNSRYELSKYPVDIDIQIRFPSPSIFSFNRKVSHLIHLGRIAAKRHIHALQQL